ncbi:NYN domain-containing protein [Kribbella sp. NPDC026611]|uniref:NYN domain-containing protein n=1 Tax=Kribbella sp. NPDC026611 TaxID=3154911 RepID=UPI0034015CE2
MRKNWPSWTGYATALWSLAYGVLGVYWLYGGAGYPFAHVPNDRATASLLEGAPVHVVAPAMAVVGLGGAVLALVMTRIRPRGSALQTVAAVLAVSLALVIPDYTLIAVVALAPAILVFAFTGVPGAQGGVGDILYWHRVNLIILFVGGLLWAATALAYHRRTRNTCVSCGRGGHEPHWQRPEAALRWGRWAVTAAVVANLPYEFTRVAWYFGWPVGISDDFHRMMADTPGMLEMGLGLAVMAMAGGVLTHGLVHRWGEVYPRWIWFKAGQRVPPLLAIVPASIVAVVLIPAGLMNAQLPLDGDNWALNAPGILWVVWGAGLGAATYAYYLRRRTTCRRCGRGPTSRSGALVGRSSGPLGGSPRAGSRARALRRSRTR